MPAASQNPVLILGGGINGAAVARELLLGGVPVWLVDTGDIAGGATSRSSRLIHGGLRYLEYGDFKLVRESLAERDRLRKLAPQFVAPLRLHIPVARRRGGLVRSALRFLGAERATLFRWLLSRALWVKPRGLWLVRLGLWFYDRFARSGVFDKSEVLPLSASGSPKVNADVYRFQGVYSDGQMLYPERFVVALLEDARQLAAEQDVEFRVLTYHRAQLGNESLEVRPVDAAGPVGKLTPALIINATGAWGDLTLGDLKLPSQKMLGGTKGSHFLTHQPALREALGSGGVYAEAEDGRLVFVLPFGPSVLVGTTDVRFPDRPERAVATEDELEYLIGLANDLFPQVDLTRDDIDMHYAGVRPLPYRDGGSTGAIPRGHQMVWNQQGPFPVLTLVGGKLTICRALAEEVVAAIADRVQLPSVLNSRDRIIPGGEDYPTDADALDKKQQEIAERAGCDIAQVAEVWSLCGTRADAILETPLTDSHDVLPGTNLPLAFVRHVIESEWVETLGDLVERRLLLHYRPELSEETLVRLAQCLADAGRIDASDITEAVGTCIEHLRETYGKQVRITTPLVPLGPA